MLKMKIERLEVKTEGLGGASVGMRFDALWSFYGWAFPLEEHQAEEGGGGCAAEAGVVEDCAVGGGECREAAEDCGGAGGE